MEKVTFAPGSVIVQEGENGDSAYFIVSGAVEVFLERNGAERRLGEIKAGEVFGEMCLIDPGPRSATVRATEETSCFVTTYDEFMALIQESPDVAIEFMRTLVRRLRELNERFAEIDGGKKGLRGLLKRWLETSEAYEMDPHFAARWPMY